jgi:serine/threonine protein phosphatase PrpC
MNAAPETLSPDLVFRSAARTHAGARRTVNEDRVLDRTGKGLWAIADGMGGHQAGDVAAATVVEAMAGVEHGASGYAYLGDIIAAVEQANAAIFTGRAAEGAGASGSTLVALIAHEGHYACLWAGDSRAYLFRDGALAAITRDHSLVQQLVDQGDVPESRRRQHPNAHIITRAVGVDAQVELDRQFAAIAPGDIFLLCSDGLTACLDDDEMARALAGGDLDAAADHLLQSALSRQALDNVSLILVQATPRAW